MNKPVIALMCKSHDYKSTTGNSFVTSAWTMSKEKATSIIGKNVVLTEGRNQPAYMGGVVTGVNQSTTEPTRFDVYFQPDENMTGNTDAVGHSGWGNGRAVCYL